MNTSLNEKDALLQLVRCGITEQAEVASFTANTPWSDVFKLAQRSGVTCLAWRGVEVAYAAGTIELPREMKMRWYAASQNCIKAMAHRRGVAKDFAAKLQPLSCVVLKGLDYARFWPNPLWREYGDLDVWLCGHFDEGNQRAIALGADFDAHDYKHSHITYRGLMVENHRYLTYFGGTRQGRRTERLLEDILRGAEFVPMADTFLLSPPADFTLIYFLRHALQHFLSEGIALRHVLDWYFLLRALPREVKAPQFVTTLRELGMLPFAQLLTDYLRSIDLPVDFPQPATTSPQLLVRFEDDLFVTPTLLADGSFLGRVKSKVAYLLHTWRFRKVLNESFAACAWGLIAYSKVFRTKAEL